VKPVVAAVILDPGAQHARAFMEGSKTYERVQTAFLNEKSMHDSYSHLQAPKAKIWISRASLG